MSPCFDNLISLINILFSTVLKPENFKLFSQSQKPQKELSTPTPPQHSKIKPNIKQTSTTQPQGGCSITGVGVRVGMGVANFT
jgi:hypothetical protein